jgi:hypothetical protein
MTGNELREIRAVILTHTSLFPGITVFSRLFFSPRLVYQSPLSREFFQTIVLILKRGRDMTYIIVSIFENQGNVFKVPLMSFSYRNMQKFVGKDQSKKIPCQRNAIKKFQR